MAPDWLLLALDLAAITVVAWLGGSVARRVGQPRIVGEMVALFAGALLLGGQVGGVVPGQLGDGRIAALFPEPVLALVTVVGGLGLILYMLLVGITIDPAPMRERAGAVALLAAATFGSMLALALVAGPLLADAGGWKPRDIDDHVFVIAIAAALGASGLPVVARILEERAMTRSAVGAVVILSATCATTMASIAAAVAIDGGDVAAGGRVALRVGAALLLIGLVVAIARARRFTRRPAVALHAAVALALASAFAGDQLLSTVLIGPLIVGIAVKTGGATAVAIEQRLGAPVRRVGLPVFLGLAALHTDLRELVSGVMTPVLLLVAAVTALKFAAGYAAARHAGFEPAEARAVGALMQCGAVMTIAISLETLDAHLIDARMHATLTLIGLMTTVAAGPLLPRGAAREGRGRLASKPDDRRRRNQPARKVARPERT